MHTLLRAPVAVLCPSWPIGRTCPAAALSLPRRLAPDWRFAGPLLTAVGGEQADGEASERLAFVARMQPPGVAIAQLD